METIELNECCKCGGPTKVETGSYGLRLRVCVNTRCGGAAVVQPKHLAKQARPRRSPVIQHKLPGLEPGQQTTSVKIPEEANQRQSMAAFCTLGWLVLQTSVRYKLQCCPACGKWHRPEGGYGASPGVPDLLVRNPCWWPALWFGLEMKGSETPLSYVQKELSAGGHIRVSRSPEQSLRLACVFDYCLSLHLP